MSIAKDRKMKKEDLIATIETIQGILLTHATGGETSDEGYVALRADLLSEPSISDFIPPMIKTCRNLSQFWGFIQPKFPTYKERREYIWGQFSPLLDRLEFESRKAPPDKQVSTVIKQFDAEHVYLGLVNK